MSSYLNFFLVPKKKEDETNEPKPLLLNSYSRAGNLYHYFMNELNVAYCDDEENPYTELNNEKCRRVLDSVKDLIETTKKSLDILYKVAQKTSTTDSDITANILEKEEYLQELNEDLAKLKAICDIICDIEYSDFEKVLINYD